MKNHFNVTSFNIKPLYYFTLIMSLVFAPSLWANTKNLLELEWLDLVPESEKIASQLMADELEYGDSDMQSELGAIRPELNGKQVRIPGFVIPLEGDADQVTEFLLVPYYGSCIHTPPPPPNQIIHVTFPQGAPDQDLWDVVYLEGKLMTQQNLVGMVETGYHIIGSSVSPYQ